MIFPCWNEMDSGQRWLYMRRLELEQQMWELRRELSRGNGGCKHVVIKGQIMFSPAKRKVVWTHEGLADDWNGGSCGASCAICGQDFGWWCPKSPDHYCHYENGEYGCDYCGEPDERK